MRDADRTALASFDELPGTAFVRLPVVCALFSVSRATVWRWCRIGELPAPIRIGGLAFWKVDSLRVRLQAHQIATGSGGFTAARPRQESDSVC